MLHDHKKIASVILTKLEPSGLENSQDMVPERADDPIQALEGTADKVITAVTSRDSHALAQALYEFFCACETAESVEKEKLEPGYGEF